jgi:tol-pal system protein YbgF
MLGAAAVLLLASGASAALAPDQSFAEPVDKRLDRLEKQLREVRDIVLQAHATGAPVEIKEAGPDPQVVALTARLDDMEQTLRGVTGQFEALGHDLALARKDASDAKAQSDALSARLDKLEQQIAAATPSPPQAQAGQGGDSGLAGQAAAQGPAVDPKAAFASARQMMFDGDFAAASSAFQAYLDQFADSPDAPAARYYLGETKYIQNDYTGAAAAYLGAIHGWPQTTWAPDAVVKLGLSLVQMKKNKDACGALAQLGRRYPNASAAVKARADAARQKAGCAP